jgi:exopolysaccharide production protein ExoQ
MPPAIATLVFAMLVVGLFVLDRDKTERTSKALWIPVIWIVLAGSRTVSQWLGVGSRVESIEQALEGDSLDRNIQLALIAVGVMVLLARGRQVRTLLRANAPILVFFAYCAASILWSDYFFVAFKRWTKATGDLLMILIVLSEPDPSAAVKRLLARIGFLLVPASVLLIKYYPWLGQGYGGMDFKVRYSGVTVDKNMLGADCLIIGLASFWCLNAMFRGRRAVQERGPLIAQGVLFTMTLWLLWKANSMTALACFILGSGVIVATSAPGLARRRAAVHILVVTVLGAAFAALFLDVGSGLVQAMGRETTLASRTELWDELLGMRGSPLFGTGFESFWLGERLEVLWARHWWRPNEAHNGYIEILLNLGWVGLSLLAVFMAAAYRSIVGALRQDPSAPLRLGYFVAGAAYGLTEAAFRPLSVVWIFFLLATVAVPKADAATLRGATPSRFRRARWAASPIHFGVSAKDHGSFTSKRLK